MGRYYYRYGYTDRYFATFRSPGFAAGRGELSFGDGYQYEGSSVADMQWLRQGAESVMRAQPTPTLR